MNSITDLITSAEKFISAERYGLALEQLHAAHDIDPGNKYIDAIVERVTNLKEAKGIFEQERDRYLSVTVDPSFPTGIKPADTRIKNLTKVAERFLDGGSIDNAFESLMSAYLLDPMSPDVIACERKVLPAWKSLHPYSTKGKSGTPSSSSKQREEREIMTKKASGLKESTEQRAESKEGQEWRLEMLKLQKELERKEKERSIWLEASKPRTPFRDAEPDEPETLQRKTSSKVERGLFSKLKLGKFLG